MNLLIYEWTVHANDLLLIAGLSLLYGWLAGWRLQPGYTYYGAGLVLIGLLRMSPLHTLGMHYLLSAHVTGHMLVLLVCAPLLLRGLPATMAGQPRHWLYKMAVAFRKWPWISWLIGLVTMWFWHIPAVFNHLIQQPDATFSAGVFIPLCRSTAHLPALTNTILLTIQPISVLVAGVCFAWPLLGLFPELRLHPLMGILYLFTACIGCSLLGLLLTFAPVGLYAYSALLADPIHRLVAQDWGITRATDQQLAGLLMWVPGCFLYLTGAMYLFIRWLSAKDPVSVAIGH